MSSFFLVEMRCFFIAHSQKGAPEFALTLDNDLDEVGGGGAHAVDGVARKLARPVTADVLKDEVLGGHQDTGTTLHHLGLEGDEWGKLGLVLNICC